MFKCSATSALLSTQMQNLTPCSLASSHPCSHAPPPRPAPTLAQQVNLLPQAGDALPLLPTLPPQSQCHTMTAATILSLSLANMAPMLRP